MYSELLEIALFSSVLTLLVALCLSITGRQLKNGFTSLLQPRYMRYRGTRRPLTKTHAKESASDV